MAVGHGLEFLAPSVGRQVGANFCIDDQSAKLPTTLSAQRRHGVDIEQGRWVGPQLDGQASLFERMLEITEWMDDHLDLQGPVVRLGKAGEQRRRLASPAFWSRRRR